MPRKILIQGLKLVTENENIHSFSIDFSSLDRMSTNCYNVYMKQKSLPLLRAREETRRQLKMIAALTGESMLDVLARLVKAEWERVQQQEKG